MPKQFQIKKQSVNIRPRYISTITELQSYRAQCTQAVALVPTMGNLHKGHLELIRSAYQDHAHVIVSIFVNPTQFNDRNDFKKYPRTLDIDLNALNAYPNTLVFVPEVHTMYPDQKRFSIHEATHTEYACGKTRPGHFSGVMTIVMKLLHLTRANTLYLGEKDFQQLQLLRDMIAAFFIPTKVIAVQTVRAPTGLALSSRNRLLTKKEQIKAADFYKILQQKKSISNTIALLTKAGFQVDYVEDFLEKRLAAVYYQQIRLIDVIDQ